MAGRQPDDRPAPRAADLPHAWPDPTTLTPAEVADAVWLAGHTAELPAQPVRSTDDPRTAPTTPAPRRPLAERSPPAATAEATEGPPPGPEPSRDVPGGLPPPHPHEPDRPGDQVRVAAVPYLRRGGGGADLSKAMRPLRQSVDSHDVEELDEDATAELIAVSRRWLPVLRPARERRWEVVVVADASASMSVWRPTIAGFVRVLEQQADFRSVYLRRLDAGPGGTVRISSGAEGSSADPRLLNDPSGRRLLLVVTDGWAPYWHSEAAQAHLAEWARTTTVAVLHVLPQSRWRNTAIRTALVEMHAPTRSAATADMVWRLLPSDPVDPQTDESWPRSTAVPVLELDRHWLRCWSSLVAGDTDGWRRLPAILVDPASPRRPAPRPLAPTAAQVVAAFRSAVSPLAAVLATRLAAAPLNLRTLLGIQRASPPAGVAHLAEVLTSGIVQPVAAAVDIAAGDRITFEFPAGVREELLRLGRRDRTIDTLRIVEQELDDLDVVQGLLARMSGAPDVRRPELTIDTFPFLQIEKLVSQSLSGPFLKRAHELRHLVAPDPATSLAPPAILSDAEPKGPAVRKLTDRAMSAAAGSAARGAATSEELPAADDLALAQTGGTQDMALLTAGSRSGGFLAGRVPVIIGNLPPKNPNFTGRVDLLAALHRRLQTVDAEQPTAVLPEAVHGMGGVGKSQLVIEYVYRNQSDYSLVWWISAERPAQISAAFVDLAQRLNLPVSSASNTAVPAVREALRLGEPQANWLLVFDNAESPEEVRPFFPVGGPGRILVTSRNPQWAHVASALEVDVFKRQESVELLTRRGPDLQPQEASRIADALGDLPLAIEQAAAWQAETGMPADEYLRLLEEKLVELLQDEDQRPLDYPTSVAAAWNVSLDALRVRDRAALRLLQICSFFAPEPIARVLLSGVRNVSVDPELDPALRDPIRLNRAIRTINRYALAKIDHRTNSIQMHRLVQRVLIGRMTTERQRAMRHGAHLMLAASDPNQPDSSDYRSRYVEFHPHLVASGAVECSDPFVRDLIYNTARALWRWGAHQEALEISQEAHAARTSALGEDDPATLKIAYWLGFMYFVNGLFADSARLNQRTLELYRRVAGERGEETLAALGAVAADRRAGGDFSEALELSERVARDASRLFGPDDPEALRAAHNLAVSLRLSSRFDEARALDEKTWAGWREIYGTDHPDTLDTAGALNLDRRELGDYVGARASQEGVVAALRRLLADEDHRAMLSNNQNLAVARRKAGDHEGALALSSTTARRYNNRYARTHVDAARATLTESIDLRGTGRLESARELGTEAVERLEAGLGPTHPHTTSARVNLAVTLRLLGDAATARAVDTDAVRLLTERLGEDHASVLAAAINLASDVFAEGDFQAAYEQDSATLERCGRVLGADHPTTLACANNLAMDALATGHADESTRLLDDTLRRFAGALGPDHPATVAAAQRDRANCDIDTLPL